MGQKVHANGFRLGFIKGWNSSWYNPLYTKGYANLLTEDLKIQEYIKGSLYGSKRLVDLINIYRNNLGTYIYFGHMTTNIKKERRRVSLLLRNRRFKIITLRQEKKKKKFLNRLKKIYLIQLILKRKKKLIKNFQNKLEYKNLSNQNLKNLIGYKKSSQIHISKININKKIIINLLNDLNKNTNNILNKKIINFLLNKKKKNKKINTLTFISNKNKKKKINTKNFLNRQNLNKNFFYKQKINNKRSKYNFKIDPLKKSFFNRRKFYLPLINILKIKKILNLITYSKIFLYLYNIRKFKRIPYNNVSLLAKLLALTFKIHTKLFSKTFKKYSFLFKKLYPKYIKGVRIKYSGKTWGKGRAKTQSFRIGNVPLNNINELIDYSFVKSQNKFGVIGVKVWLNHYYYGKNSKYRYLRSKERKLLANWRHRFSILNVKEYKNKIRKITSYSTEKVQIENYIAYNLTRQSKIRKFINKQKFYNSYIKRKSKIKNKNLYFYSKKFVNTLKSFKNKIKGNPYLKRNSIIRLIYKPAIKSNNLIIKNNNISKIMLNNYIYDNSMYYHPVMKKVTPNLPKDILPKGIFGITFPKTSIKYKNNLMSNKFNNYKRFYSTYNKYIKTSSFNNNIKSNLLIKNHENVDLNKSYPQLRTHYYNYYKNLQINNESREVLYRYKIYNLYDRYKELNKLKVFKEILGLKNQPRKKYMVFPRKLNQFIFYGNKFFFVNFSKQKASPYATLIKCKYDFRPLSFRRFNTKTKLRNRRIYPHRYNKYRVIVRKGGGLLYFHLSESNSNLFLRLTKLFGLNLNNKIYKEIIKHNQFKEFKNYLPNILKKKLTSTEMLKNLFNPKFDNTYNHLEDRNEFGIPYDDFAKKTFFKKLNGLKIYNEKSNLIKKDNNLNLNQLSYNNNYKKNYYFNNKNNINKTNKK